MRLSITIIATLFALVLNAQVDDLKFGKISFEEVVQKEHLLDPEAEAAILYKKVRLYYSYDPDKGFSSKREVHLRIKIYKKSGLDWATLIVPLYTSNSAEQKIYGVKGITYNVDGTKVIEDKLKNSSVFTENINKYRNQVSISMPSVKEGSVIDLEYEIGSNLIGYMNPFIIQYGIPVDYVDIDVDIPEYFNFKKYLKGFYPIKLNESTTKKTENFQYRKDTNSLSSIGVDYVRPTVERGSLDYFETEYSIKAKNIPALRGENFTDNIENYRSAVVFELESTKFPSEGYRMFSQTWDDVANAIYKYDNFGRELDKSRFFEKEIDALIAQYKDKDELVAAIFHLVKSHMTWNGYFGVGCESGIKKAFEERKGNVADINLMLTAMLRYAGFKANPVLVSTKDHGIPMFPTTDGFNYVISALEMDESYVLLDATENMLGINELPNRAINWNGRLVREDGTSKAISSIPKSHSEKTIFMNVQIFANGNTTGEMQTRLTNNLAYEYRKSNIEKRNDELIKDKTGLNLGLEIENIETKNVNQPNTPVIETMSFSKEGEVELIGDKLYLSPMLFLAINDNPFKLQKREYPIDFVYPRLEKTTISFKIPQGYKVESLPENIAIGLPDNVGIFNFVIKENGNGIQLVCSMELNNALVSPILYEPLKEFYNQIVQKQNEKIVLSKI